MNEGFEESRFISLKTHAQVSSFDDDLSPEKVEDVDKDVFESGVDALDDIIHGSFSGVIITQCWLEIESDFLFWWEVRE